MTYPPPQQGFSQPSAPNTGDKFEAHEHNGSLLLVFPKRFEENIKTTKGLSDATDADIVIVDKFGPTGQPLAFFGARLFGNLARSVRNDIGGQVLGRLNQITSANGNTPWILENFTDQEAAAAGPVLAAYQQGLFKPTETPMQAPAPAAAAAAPAQQWQGAPQQQWQQQAAPAAPASGAASSPAPQQQWSPVTGQPTAPPPQQYQQQAAPAAQWNAPAPAAAAPSAAPTPSPAPAVDPALVAFLGARGVQVTPDMVQDQCTLIGRSFPDFASNFPHYN